MNASPKLLGLLISGGTPEIPLVLLTSSTFNRYGVP